MKCAVLGSPIAHSRSPQLHQAGYALLGIDWTYIRDEVSSGGLETYLAKLNSEWAGLSLTMPLKEEGLRLAHWADDLALRVGGANTLIQESGNWNAYNTDVSGFAQILERYQGLSQVSILGGGATARAALAALSTENCHVTVYLRSAHRSESIYRAFGNSVERITLRDWSERREALLDPLLISTTPSGASDDLALHVQDSSAEVTTQLFIDALYGNWPTPLASAFMVKGSAVVSGKTLLVYQAVEQLRLMTGLDFEKGAMAEELFKAVEK